MIILSPGGGPCVATKRALDQAGLRCRVIDLTEDGEAMAYVQDLGYRHAPVVVTKDGQHRLDISRVRALDGFPKL